MNFLTEQPVFGCKACRQPHEDESDYGEDEHHPRIKQHRTRECEGTITATSTPYTPHPCVV